jgi:hypothetical protein
MKQKSPRHGTAPGQARPQLSGEERLPVGIVKDWAAHKKRERKSDDDKTARLRALREKANPTSG